MFETNSDQTGVNPSFRVLAENQLVLPASGVPLGPVTVTRRAGSCNRAGAWGSWPGQTEKPLEGPATAKWPHSNDGRHRPLTGTAPSLPETMGAGWVVLLTWPPHHTGGLRARGRQRPFWDGPLSRRYELKHASHISKLPKGKHSVKGTVFQKVLLQRLSPAGRTPLAGKQLGVR